MTRSSRAGGKKSAAKARKTGGNLGKTRRRTAADAIRPKRPSASDLSQELKEAREQQAATAQILKVIASSPDKLQTVLDTIAKTSRELCGSEGATIFLLRDGKLYFTAIAGGVPKHLEYLRDNPAAIDEPGSAFWQVLQKKCTVHYANVFDYPELDHDSVRLGGPRALLLVPLLRDREILGIIVLRQSHLRPFTPPQIQAIEVFANQAVIAISNVGLFDEVQTRTRELAESLRFQTATSDVLKVISRSPDTLEPVLDTIAKTSHELCGCDGVSIYLLRDDKFHYAAVSGPVPKHVEYLRNNPAPISQTGSVFTRVARQKRTLHYPNIADDPDLTKGTTGLGGPRALLLVPLMQEDEFIGTIVLRQQADKAFTPRQIQAVETFADQAVIAISNVNLFDQVQQRTRELTESLQFQTASSEVLKVISQSPDALQPVLDAIVKTSRELCGSDASTMFLLRDREFHMAAVAGALPSHADQLKANPQAIDQPGTLLARSAREKRTLYFSNVLDDPELRDGLAGRGGPRALLAAPLMTDGQVIGVIVLRQSHLKPFTPKQIQAIETFADQAVIAISNVNLFEEVQQRTRELTQSLDDLRTAQDRLIQTEKLASLGQLTAGIAHEIKNPLNFVNNFSALSVELTEELKEILTQERLSDKGREDSEELTGMLKDNLEKVVQHGKRADSIVKNMLLHSRESSSERRSAEINQLVEESLNLAYHGARAEEAGFSITLKHDLDPEAGELDLYPQEMTRALLNMISNGFYAATKRKAEAADEAFEPVLCAITRNLGASIEIRIRDNGTGIPPEVKEKMFNPFFTTKPTGEGTGLGLSMTHDIIVKQHGGRIDVETEPGAFTEFIITLPREKGRAIKRE